MTLAQLRADVLVVRALGWRSIRNTFRRPQYLAPLVIFPTLFLAVNTGGAGAAVRLDGFPEVHGFLDFQLASGMLQSTMLAAVMGGTGLAMDIELGFTDRLFAAPISRPAIVLGRLAATFVMGCFAACWFLAIGLIFGAWIKGGPIGAIVVILMAGLCATAFGGIAAALALKSGTTSVVQGTFPLVFVIMFLSSAFFPVDLMAEPAQTIARLNPLSFVADGLRQPIITGLSTHVFLSALLGVAVIGTIGFVTSGLALRGRLKAN
ncbi:MAG: type transport system permease protein [Thermoleophilaceae bacterium]|nr:type transport system permease protein [Thermoleophilaceae bacterium]